MAVGLQVPRTALHEEVLSSLHRISRKRAKHPSAVIGLIDVGSSLNWGSLFLRSFYKGVLLYFGHRKRP